MAATTTRRRQQQPAAPPGTPITDRPAKADAKAATAAAPAAAPAPSGVVVDRDLDTDVREPVMPPPFVPAAPPRDADVEHLASCPKKGRRFETYRVPDPHGRETTVTRCLQCGRSAAATTAPEFTDEEI